MFFGDQLTSAAEVVLINFPLFTLTRFVAVTDAIRGSSLSISISPTTAGASASGIDLVHQLDSNCL
jgi:hypothetical protein